MTLKEFLSSTKISLSDFANLLGLSGKGKGRTVHRYVTGERIPTAHIMQKISEITSGQVTANDFYSLPLKEEAKK